MKKIIYILVVGILIIGTMTGCNLRQPSEQAPDTEDQVKTGDEKPVGDRDGEAEEPSSTEKIDVSKWEESIYEDSQQDRQVKLSVKEQDIAKGVDKITLVYINLSSKEYIYGEEPHLEVESDGKWYVVPMLEGVAWHDIGYILSAKGTREDVFTITNFYEGLDVGKYRMIKKLHPEDGEMTFTIAEFQVK